MALAFPKPRVTADKRAKRRAKEAQWQAVRKAVLARDGRRCRVCGSRDAIEAHHIRFRSVGGEDATRNTACLCATCHAEVHGYRLAIQGDADGTLRIVRER